MTADDKPTTRLGLRVNIAQFSLLVGVNALVGGMLGQERTVVPLLATEVFGVPGYTAALTFIVAFGLAKAATNYFAGTLSDRYGRKPVLVAGWLVALPVPFMLIWAPSWGWVVFANVLLGVSQGLTWSTTVVMKIDLVGPARRGLAMGFNEAAWYAAFAALGLGISTLFVRETREHARLEARTHVARVDGRHDHLGDDLTNGQVFAQTSFKEPALSAASQAGLVNNLNDGLAWGLFPVLFLSAGLSIERIGLLAAIYPMVWGVGQLVTGGLSDRWGRKWLIAGGMGVQAAGLAIMALADGFAWWASAAVLLGAGFAVGAVLAGVLADLYGVRTAIGVVAALTALSGVVVAVRMYETKHDPAPSSPVTAGGPR